MPWYPGDYQRDTQHLTTLEHGAYRLLIDACWCRGGTLPSDDGDLARIVHLQPSEWLAIRSRIASFFNTNNGEWTHKRVTEELKKSKDHCDAIHRRAKAGSDARWRKNQAMLKQCSGNAKAIPKNAPSPSPSPTPSPKTNSVECSSEKMNSDWNSNPLSTKVVSILGNSELVKRPDWFSRIEKHPERMETVMNTIHAEILEGNVIKNRGAYAEALWKKTE